MKNIKKRAVVTGGSSGIGEKIVKKLLENNFEIIILDKNDPYLSDINIRFIRTDFTNQEEIIRATEDILRLWDKLDVLINCAGIYPSIRIDDYSLQIWDDCMNINVRAPYIFSKNLLSALRNNNGAYIVNITSGAVTLGSRDPGYSASKSALAGLTKSLAQNLAKDNILVNAVAPGPIDTPMSKAGMRPEDVATYQEKILLKRFGQPSEVAEAVFFLVSGAAKYLTGTTIHVNGGLYCS